MELSIIIPTLNEADTIGQLLDLLTTHGQRKSFEIIVVDGGSQDGTLELVTSYSGVSLIRTEKASRAHQMNKGAKSAKSDLLYFVHSDVVLPDSFYEDIQLALSSSFYGGYRYQFDSGTPLLKVNAFFTRFPMMWCRGGDQTLYITRSLFDKLGGFDEYYCVMEDFDLLRRAAQIAKYHIIQKDVIVSARKYHGNGYFKVQLANLNAFRMFNRGEDPQKIRSYYKLALGLKDY
ncbi:TIGR04283 family arsenosugar biosynthesis glycosyltransferase [Marinoscillum sp.]|uniref:TIGR04283 family arsenosugar biosynthesis glycosyltransferase n=1 Tax=Marinoscillum sp. TaxID=2024838 RepID=UPI003BAC8594